LRSCGAARKPGGNREDKHQPVPLGEPDLPTKSWANQPKISSFFVNVTTLPSGTRLNKPERKLKSFVKKLVVS
jgi:hypothetical protein